MSAGTRSGSPDVPIPFDACDPSGTFVFVSYAHDNKALVYPELRRIRSFGIRVWYDEGIEPGSEWPEAIATALDRAAALVVMITPSAVASRNVRNEINAALRWGKPVFAVHLAQTALPKGLELQMGAVQAIMRWRMDEDSYARRLGKALAGYAEAGNVMPPAREEAEPKARDGGGSLGDLLDVFKRGRNTTQNRPRRGADVETETTLSSTQAALGAMVTLRLIGEGPCPTCNGTGAGAGTVPRVCTTCGGTGLGEKKSTSAFAEPCLTCRGRGLVVDAPCPACSGMGRAITHSFQARIPAGVRDGQRVRVTGKGAPGERGGQAGDLYVLVHVQP